MTAWICWRTTNQRSMEEPHQSGVNKYWVTTVKCQADLYPSLHYLNFDAFIPGQRCFLVQLSGDLREVPRVAVKLKIVTDTHILQTTRAAFNQNTVYPMCLVCKEGHDTLQHFLLDCISLKQARDPELNQIRQLCSDNDRHVIPPGSSGNLLEMEPDSRTPASATESPGCEKYKKKKKFVHNFPDHHFCTYVW